MDGTLRTRASDFVQIHYVGNTGEVGQVESIREKECLQEKALTYCPKTKSSHKNVQIYVA